MKREERAKLSLDGLSVGDAFGERFFGDIDHVVARIVRRELPAPPWPYTDDTEMALSVVEVLLQSGAIDQDVLARRFADRMDLSRGYGEGAFKVLDGIRNGHSWRALSRAGFRGIGSFGNGAAMRVAPLGAYFADEPLQVIIEQARLSAEVTHAHEEGVDGAIAVAVGAAMAWQRRSGDRPLGRDWLTQIRDVTTAKYMRQGLDDALMLSPAASIVGAAQALGNGSGVTAPDTVPLCLWIAAHASTNFAEAMWRTVSALGDRDTTCAIVGGILAMRSGRTGIPTDWLSAREDLVLEDEGASPGRDGGHA